MTIEQSRVIDLLGVDNTSGEVVLTIIDQLSWEDETEHLLALQTKLQTYISYIESGEIAEQEPDYVKKGVRIEIRSKYAYPSDVITNLKDLSVESGVDVQVMQQTDQ